MKERSLSLVTTALLLFVCIESLWILREFKREALNIIWRHGHLPASYGALKSRIPVAQRVGNAIHRISHYSMDSGVCFANIYPLDGDLSGG